MNERQQITAAFHEACVRDEAAALATVVAVHGSAYRRPGARMLVTENGRRVGHVSGGCLERDVIRHAGLVLSHDEPVLRQYDSLDEDLADGFALGCNGAVLVLIEPANANVRHLMQAQITCLKRRCRGAIATVYASPHATVAQIGARVSIVEGDTPCSVGVGTVTLEDALGKAVSNALALGSGGDWSMPTEAGTISAFIELVTPPLSVMVFGAGHDVVPLVEFGHSLGWSMHVIASVGGFGVRERFLKADTLHVGTPHDAVAALKPGQETIALLMSHNFPRDLEAFCALARSRPRYIGLLGPRHRALRLIEEAQAQGTMVDEALRACVFGPVGLDIGAETPAEVALAIVAEINATVRHRNGSPARLRKLPLHAPSEGGPESHTIDGTTGPASCGPIPA